MVRNPVSGSDITGNLIFTEQFCSVCLSILWNRIIPGWVMGPSGVVWANMFRAGYLECHKKCSVSILQSLNMANGFLAQFIHIVLSSVF